MIITLNIYNKQFLNKILWLLNHFKNDGLEIIVDSKMDITQKLLQEKAWK